MDQDRQREAIASFASTIRKLEKACNTMDIHHSSIAIAKQRLEASRIGLAVIQDPSKVAYSYAELSIARDILSALLPTIIRSRDSLGNAKPQHTLLERRIRSLELAIGLLDEILGENRL